MATADLGKVVGLDGFNPIVQVLEDTLESYRLTIQDKTHVITTPNLRGITANYYTVELHGAGSKDIPFPDLGLNPDKDYAFYAAPGMNYPLLRHVSAIRVANMLRVSAYYDTNPYTTPQAGSPFTGGVIKIGMTGLQLGEFNVGETTAEEGLPVNVLCFEITGSGRVRVKIGQPGLKIGSFQVGQEVAPSAAE
jgi:hypothetical protein